MTDREMLELAALAAGINAQWDCPKRGMMMLTPDGIDTMTWNPLADDGDALRLAVRLGLKITCPKYANYGTSAEPQTGETPGCTAFRKDPMQQTRVAIVTAAAEIGKQMKARA